MSKRLAIIIVALSVCGAALLSGCARMVRVETGELVTCTYGEVVTDTVRVVEVPADKAAGYSVVTKTVTCDRHKRLEALYAEAQAAIVASDLAAARAKLAEIVAADAAFKRAKAQLDAIVAGKKPLPDSGGSGGGSGSGGKQPVGPVANLSGWVPNVLPGYAGAPITSDVYTITREYVPAAGGPADSLVIVVEQYRDAAAAKAAIAGAIAPGSNSDVSTVQIAGRSVRFGTDGSRFATLAWNENGVLIVLEASSASRKPAGLKSHLVSLASQIVR
jgi:hypothetical protein